MRITVDPDASAAGFGYATDGKYTLRVSKEPEQKKKDHPYLKWTFEFADPNVKAVNPGEKVGNIFENTTLKKGDNAQFRLRQLCDALGLVWGDFDTADVIGMEFQAEVGIKEYNGTLSNEVKKYYKK